MLVALQPNKHKPLAKFNHHGESPRPIHASRLRRHVAVEDDLLVFAAASQ